MKRLTKLDRLIVKANETGQVQSYRGDTIHPTGKGRNYAYIVEGMGDAAKKPRRKK